MNMKLKRLLRRGENLIENEDKGDFSIPNQYFQFLEGIPMYEISLTWNLGEMPIFSSQEEYSNEEE